LTNFY